jgi:heat shock protein HtpX
MTGNWRGVARKNLVKSRWVIASFFMIYAALGALIDWIYFYSQHQIPTQFELSGTIIFMVVLAGLSYLSGRFFAKTMMLHGLEYQEVNADSEVEEDQALYGIVEEMKIAASLNYMPKIYVANCGYMNAFATGWNEKNAAIVITRPLMNILTRDELQAVVAHEITHIRNQDVRLSSSVFVMSGLLLFLIDVIFRSLIYGGASRRREKGGVLPILLLVFALRIILPIVTMALGMFLSRSREFMADSGAVELTRQNEPLARALIKIHQQHQTDQSLNDEYANMPNESLRSGSYLYDPRMSGFKNWLNVGQWFSSHPSLDQRLKQLGYQPQKTSH